jgi:predicted RNA binding protein YcfA (HicA-like mRNA interferase family)
MPRIVPIHWQALEKVFLEFGFRFARQEGSHRSYVKPGVLRPIVIPTYKEGPVSIIRKQLENRRDFQGGILPDSCGNVSRRHRHCAGDSPRSLYST